MKYTISYDHIAASQTRTTESIFELLKWLDELLSDDYVAYNSIVINTETNQDDNRK